MARIHLLLGPVGAGKSTYARRLCGEHPAVIFDLDDWMVHLFGDDERPPEGRLEWYLCRRDRVLAQIWRTAESVIDVGSDVILELGLIRRDERNAFLARVDDCDHDLTLHLLDAPRDERRRRVVKRNGERGATFSMEVPLEVFEMASDLWEPLEDSELIGRDVRRVI